MLIEDIDQRVQSAFVSSFADDTRAAGAIATEEDAQAFQRDLQTIYEWSEENDMEFNSAKFECIRYGRNEELKAATHYLDDSGNPIRVVGNVKDLGVIMSDTGTFQNHIYSITETAISCVDGYLELSIPEEEYLCLHYGSL